jgi:hypothetical protein
MDTKQLWEKYLNAKWLYYKAHAELEALIEKQESQIMIALKKWQLVKLKEKQQVAYHAWNASFLR